jgi:hypothetical protein
MCSEYVNTFAKDIYFWIRKISYFKWKNPKKCRTNKQQVTTQYNKPFVNLMLILFGAIILLFFAFNNNYPLVYPDSGTYIYSGFEMKIPIDRPIFYGLFLRHMSLATSLWYVVFAQSVILTYLLYIVFRVNFNKTMFRVYFIVSIFILTFTTGISFNVSMLTADIFTSLLFLSFYLILFPSNLSRRENWFVHFIFILSLFTHNSHIGILFVTLICITVLQVLRKELDLQFPFSIKRVLYTACAFIFAVLMIPCINYVIGKKFVISESSHIFIMHKLNDEEVLEPYLNENCEKYNYSICQFKDKLPWDLLWDPRSPITKDGDWNRFKEEDNRIILDILTTYKYSKKIFLKRIQQTFRQLFNFDTGDAPADDMINPPLNEINHRFNDEKKEFLSSQQVNKKLNFNILNYIQSIFIFLSILIFALILLLKINWLDIKIKAAILILLIYEFSNALVCSTLAIVLDRFQSRVIWLLPLFALIILFKYIESNGVIFKMKAERK